MNILPPQKRKELVRTIKAMKKEGKTFQQIADALGYKSKNSITHLLKDKS